MVMRTGRSRSAGVDRRSALKVAAGAGIAAAGGVALTSRKAKAATTLTIWTGFPELVPYYKSVAEAYAKVKPDVTVNLLSSSLREMEQKLSAAIPTGTGPDIFDIGSGISIKFIEAGLLDPNPADVDQYLKSGAWNKFTVDWFTTKGKTHGLPLLEGRAAMFYNKAMFKEAGIANPPTTFGELMDAAKKLTKFDATGKMTRAGISMRLSGQGSGITEKFRMVLEPAGGQLIKQAPSGKWHNGFDNDAGRKALQFYVDVVQKDKVDDPKIPHDADAFANQHAAMLFREAWVIGEIKKKNPTLDYGVVPIPRWDANSPYKGIVQPWGVYVNGKSRQKPASWDYIKFLTQPQNAFQLTNMTGWVSRREGVDWGPLIKETPQFEVFVRPPANIELFADPILGPWDEIQTRIADRLPAMFVDPALNGNPAKVAEAIKSLATIADNILKQAGIYGTA
jgi:multiple sugar transport system substrate-binding protein